MNQFSYLRWEKVRLKRLVVLVFVILVLASFVSAERSTFNIHALDNQISPSEKATFELSLTNKADSIQRFSLFSFAQGWIIEPNPLKDKIIDLAPGQTYKTTIEVTPLEDFAPGIYTVGMNIESDLGDRHLATLKLYLNPDQPLDYLPAIKAVVDMDEKISPQEPVSVTLFLENRNPLDLKDLVIRIQSDIPEFVQEARVDLPPLSKKTVDFTITPNRFTQPKEYFLFFVFQKDGETVKVIDKKIEIISLEPPFDFEETIEKKYLRYSSTLAVTNNGNVLNTQLVKVPASWWKALFSNADSQLEDGQRYLVWELTLKPSEQKSIEYVTNYRIFVYILLLLAIFGIFYYSVQSPFVLKKKAITTKMDQDGSLSEIKVTLEVRNKSKKTLKHLSIEDVVPAIANVEKSLELGTLRPHAIKHTKHGTKVVWNLAELDGLEHRLITYKVKAKLNILGTFSLPRAVVKYSKGKKHKKVFSNVFRLSS
tara:strand:+ start:5214 stop:6659 length:1446 start_codon:yes stop_codon:yes gene_type:complete